MRGGTPMSTVYSGYGEYYYENFIRDVVKDFLEEFGFKSVNDLKRIGEKGPLFSPLGLAITLMAETPKYNELHDRTTKKHDYYYGVAFKLSRSTETNINQVSGYELSDSSTEYLMCPIDIALLYKDKSTSATVIYETLAARDDLNQKSHVEKFLNDYKFKSVDDRITVSGSISKSWFTPLGLAITLAGRANIPKHEYIYYTNIALELITGVKDINEKSVYTWPVERIHAMCPVNIAMLYKNYIAFNALIIKRPDVILNKIAEGAEDAFFKYGRENIPPLLFVLRYSVFENLDYKAYEKILNSPQVNLNQVFDLQDTIEYVSLEPNKIAHFFALSPQITPISFLNRYIHELKMIKKLRPWRNDKYKSDFEFLEDETRPRSIVPGEVYESPIDEDRYKALKFLRNHEELEINLTQNMISTLETIRNRLLDAASKKGQVLQEQHERVLYTEYEKLSLGTALSSSGKAMPPIKEILALKRSSLAASIDTPIKKLGKEMMTLPAAPGGPLIIGTQITPKSAPNPLFLSDNGKALERKGQREDSKGKEQKRDDLACKSFHTTRMTIEQRNPPADVAVQQQPARQSGAGTVGGPVLSEALPEKKKKKQKKKKKKKDKKMNMQKRPPSPA